MKNSRILYLSSVILLAVLLIFDLIMLFCIAPMEGAALRQTGGVILDPNAMDERPNEGSGGSPGVTVAGFSALTIPSDIETIAVDLQNPIKNNGLYYLSFEFRLPDESEQGYEVLFKTGYVAPGKHIYQVTLSHGLPAGEYTAQLLIQPYRMIDLTPTNNVSAIVKLTVKQVTTGNPAS